MWRLRIELLEPMTCEQSEPLCVDHSDAHFRRMAFREAFRLFRDGDRNAIRSHNGDRHGSRRALLGGSLGLEDRLGEEWDQAVATALGKALQLDEESLTIGIN